MRARRERVTFFTILPVHCASVAATLSQGPTGGYTCSHRFWSVLCGPKLARFWDSPKRAGKIPPVGLLPWEKRRGSSSGDDFPEDIPSASCSSVYFFVHYVHDWISCWTVFSYLSTSMSLSDSLGLTLWASSTLAGESASSITALAGGGTLRCSVR